MARALTVMAGLDPAIHRGTGGARMAGSSPAMTVREEGGNGVTA
jgi:hypothetical protein